MKACNKCLVEKPFEEFAKMAKAKDGYQPSCKPCNNAFARQNYHDNKERYFDKARKRDQEMRQRLIDIKSVPCGDCGVQYPSYVMEFDHLEDKEFGIAEMMRHRMAWAKIEAEIAKCEVVCANCHRVRTFQRRGMIPL